MIDPRATLHRALETLLAELVYGHEREQSYILNTGDRGLLHALDQLSAHAASAVPPGGRASIAAHTDHLRYGISLMNRWSEGEENPFASADWAASWRKVEVSEDEWARLRADLRSELERWLGTVRQPRDLHPIELTGMIASVAHLAYHMGAIRQMDRAARGPADPGLADATASQETPHGG